MPEEIEESVEALPSADNGNVPVDAPNSDQTQTAAPAETTEPVTPAATESELFELPDGRKVNAGTLAKEWKDNFMPDYTRKSQELAKTTTNTETLQTENNKPTPKIYEDPEWQPNSYAELIAIAKEEVKGDFAAEERLRIEHAAAIENTVVNQLNEIKTTDSTLNENALFNHAIKYGFKDLKLAHQNMKDMSEVIKKTQTVTAANIARRNDPVSISPGATGAKPNPSNFGNAVDFLRSLK